MPFKPIILQPYSQQLSIQALLLLKSLFPGIYPTALVAPPPYPWLAHPPDQIPKHWSSCGLLNPFYISFFTILSQKDHLYPSGFKSLLCGQCPVFTFHSRLSSGLQTQTQQPLTGHLKVSWASKMSDPSRIPDSFPPHQICSSSGFSSSQNGTTTYQVVLAKPESHYFLPLTHFL